MNEVTLTVFSVGLELQRTMIGHKTFKPVANKYFGIETNEKVS